MITQIWRFGEFLNQSFSLSCWQSSWWWPSPFGQPSMSNSYRAHRRTAIAYNVPVSMSNACAINLKMVIFYFLNKFTRERKKSNIRRTITHFITYSLNNRTDSMFWLSPNKSFFFSSSSFFRRLQIVRKYATHITIFCFRRRRRSVSGMSWPNGCFVTLNASIDIHTHPIVVGVRFWSLRHVAHTGYIHSRRTDTTFAIFPFPSANA